jgi:hypothetical protein
METVTYTLGECFRPIAVAIGESINQFYSAITKDLSFYQYIPLLIGVTIISVVLIVFGSAFFSLLLFNYELNFFHLVKFRKTTDANNNSNAEALKYEKSELIKVLRELKRENRFLNAAKKASIVDKQQQPNVINTLSSVACSLAVPVSSKSERVRAIEHFDTSQDDDDDETQMFYANKSDEMEDLNEEVEEENDEKSLNESILKNFELYKEKNEKKDKYYEEKIKELKMENLKVGFSLNLGKANHP